jgi:predicted AAA+ superfamily ATPase
MSGLVSLLHPYFNNVSNRIVKTPKIYFLDTGLCAYLTGWDTVKSLEAGAMNGAILETYVYAEILKSYWHNAKEPLIYFYRDKEQKEIDFIIEANGTLYPVEVKKTLMPNTDMTKNFDALKKSRKPIGQSIILCLKPEILFLKQNLASVPIWAI